MAVSVLRALDSDSGYTLDEQVGYILRQANQRHTNIFAKLMIEDLTPTQWAALAKLNELGPCSQNLLGRKTSMDAATIKGVIDRLTKRGMTSTSPDPEDGRRLMVALTEDGRTIYERALAAAEHISAETLHPLSAEERSVFLRLLKKLT